MAVKSLGCVEVSHANTATWLTMAAPGPCRAITRLLPALPVVQLSRSIMRHHILKLTSPKEQILFATYTSKARQFFFCFLYTKAGLYFLARIWRFHTVKCRMKLMTKLCKIVFRNFFSSLGDALVQSFISVNGKTDELSESCYPPHLFQLWPASGQSG